MGVLGIVRFLVFALLVSLPAQAREKSCPAGLVSIFPLGGEVPVLSVEKIAKDRAKLLEPYGHGSVQSQLSGWGKFGLVAALEGKEVLGYLVGDTGRGHMNLNSIAVVEGKERQGVGRALVESLLEKARETPGIDEVRALVVYKDQGTRDFLIALGFVEAEVMPGKFGRGTQSGVLLKYSIRNAAEEEAHYLLQLAPQKQRKRVAVAVDVLPATLEELKAMDPTLENAD